RRNDTRGSILTHRLPFRFRRRPRLIREYGVGMFRGVERSRNLDGGCLMGRGGAGLIAAVLALAGCKSTDSKPAGKETTGAAAAHAKNKDTKDKDVKGATWLEPTAKLPGAETSVPKAGSWAGDPGSPNFNAKAESQDAVGGRVVDTFNRPAKN